MELENPALQAFLRQFTGKLVLAQVLIRAEGPAYELRHAEDGERSIADLESIPVGDLWKRAQFSEAGAFRPLKSAPNLARGWRCLARGDEEFEAALGVLYPGALADWHAARDPEPPITHFRAFTARQSGIYQIASLLEDHQAVSVARSCCDPRFCLKRRLWTAPGLPSEKSADKSAIPCLEPCALLLDLARTAMLLEQDGRRPFGVSLEETETLRAALAAALLHPDPGVREGDLTSPRNPRRIRLLLDRLERESPFGPP